MLWTYACHELEHACLRLIEQNSNFVQTREHLGIFTHGPRHATSQGISEIVVDVQLTRRARRKESIVQA